MKVLFKLKFTIQVLQTRPGTASPFQSDMLQPHRRKISFLFKNTDDKVPDGVTTRRAAEEEEGEEDEATDKRGKEP